MPTHKSHSNSKRPFCGLCVSGDSGLPVFKMPSTRMVKLCRFLVLLLAVWIPQQAVGEPRLVLAQILFRHGTRAPEDPYPTDPFQDGALYWPNGWGQLTDFGKEQQYQLGKYLRQRYTSFLSPNYVPDELQVTSSGYNRTISSALLTLAGMYPNSIRNQYEYSRLGWQPIPVQTINSGSNHLMLHPSYVSKAHVCPRYWELLQAIDEHPIVKEALTENRILIEDLREKTGIGDTKSWKHIAAGYMMGTVKIEKFYNLSIPQWADEVISSPTNRRFFSSVFAYLTLTDEMKRLLAGPIMSEWIQHMRSRQAGNETAKLYIYSAHDLNLINVLNTMGLNDPPRVPEMGSTLFVELYEDTERGVGTGSYVVQLAYRDGLTTEVQSLALPGCADPCTLDSFVATLEKYLVEDLDRECGILLGSSPMHAGHGVVTALDGVLIAIICVLVLVVIGLEVYHRKVKTKSKMYTIESK